MLDFDYKTNDDVFCLERIEQILYTYNYEFNSDNNCFEKDFYSNTEYTKTKSISFLNSVDSVLVITEYRNPKKESNLFYGNIPKNEFDFEILSDLLNLNCFKKIDIENIDSESYNKILSNFKNILLKSDYSYKKDTYYKKLTDYTDIHVYICLKIDVKLDKLIIYEKYGHKNVNILTNSTILYDGKIPKTRSEFKVLISLIDLSIILN